MLTSARDLFTRQGYADTTVAAVADRADVSVDTIYASVGRKPQLMLAVIDVVLGEENDPVPAEQRDYVRAIRARRSRRRAANMLLFASDLRRTGEVRGELTDEVVADIVWSTNSVEYYLLLRQRRWTSEQYARWLADLWCRTLLAQGPGSSWTARW
ncbi:MAG: helix-turn-helix domain-containing protein [Nocardioidaceae bacterium]